MNQPSQQPRLITFDQHPYLPYEGHAIPEVIHKHWDVISRAYEGGFDQLPEEIPVYMVYPNELMPNLKQEVFQALSQYWGNKVRMVNAEHLALPYLHGVFSREELESSFSLVIEALDDKVNACYVRIKNAGKAWVGPDELFATESSFTEVIKTMGPSAGNEKLLREIMREFEAAGFSLNLKGQTDLAYQLENPPQDFVFRVNQETESVELSGKLSFSPERFEELLAANKESLADIASAGVVARKGIDRVLLLGKFMQNKYLLTYLQHDLAIGPKLINMNPYSEDKEYETILKGMVVRANLIQKALDEEKLEEERKKKEAEQREKVAAELKTKNERELLFDEIKQTCIRLEEQEMYEARFIPRGEQLGIPEVVIKWNISEILSKIELEEKAEKIGIIKEEKAEESEEEEPQHPIENKVEQTAPVNIPETYSNGHDHPETKTSEVVKEEVEPKPEIQPVREEKVVPEMVNEVPEEEPEIPVDEPAVLKEPTPVIPNISPNANHEGTAVQQAVIEKKPSVNPVATPIKPAKKENAKLLSLGDVFTLRRNLEDPEFETKVVSFKGDSELYELRLISTEKESEPESMRAFSKLYQKELTYFPKLSEVSGAKEGKYYYRPFLERSTLKDFVRKNGLDKRKNVNDLSSNDLKFILQVFKEVRELKISHANLNEENILIHEKRKWGLSKNMEIKFVGFTSEDCTNEAMIEATHTAFANLMGKKFYSDFREKFQL